MEKIEELFNQLFDFNKLVNDAIQYIEKVLLESDSNFLSEDITEDRISYKQLRIEYNKTHLFVNETGRKPFFRIQFNLYEYGCEIPKYIYEIEYNSAGEFSDEYFLEY